MTTLPPDHDNVVILIPLRHWKPEQERLMRTRICAFAPHLKPLSVGDQIFFPLYGMSGNPCGELVVCLYRDSPDNPVLDSGDFGRYGQKWEFDGEDFRMHSRSGCEMEEERRTRMATR